MDFEEQSTPDAAAQEDFPPQLHVKSCDASNFATFAGPRLSTGRGPRAHVAGLFSVIEKVMDMHCKRCPTLRFRHDPVE
jgi:hypothetical protein